MYEYDQSSSVDRFIRVKSSELRRVLEMMAEEGADLRSWSTFSVWIIPEWLEIRKNLIKNVLREYIRKMIDEAREGFVCAGGEEKDWSAESES